MISARRRFLDLSLTVLSFSAIARSVMISAALASYFNWKHQKGFSAIARSVMISACFLLALWYMLLPSFSAIARSVMISAYTPEPVTYLM